MTTDPKPSTAATATATGTDGAGAWQATHIYYAANPRPLLLNCVRPLVAELESDGLLAGYFFINYWLEGPHIRLRIKPARPEAAEEVRGRTEEALARFLAERPALYEVDSGFLNEFYNKLFEIEFSSVERAEYTDAEGRMNLQPNNTFRRVPYEPEYAKYGGPAGIELAEWHFRRSSDLVIDAFGTKNLHLRTVLLGTAAQLMTVMSTAFLPTRERLAEYMDSYYQFWHRAFPNTGFVGSTEYDRRFNDVAPQLAAQYTRARAAVTAADEAAGSGDTASATATGRLPAFLAGWADHSRELRDRAVALAESGQLVFRGAHEDREQVVTDPADALRRLLSPYMHMTNNRLHVTIQDEAYLSHMLGRTLSEYPMETAGAGGAGEAA
ncbi:MULTISPECIES: lantibiotic dehydratase C-terminal domain-containing protein [unclassified Streptomyces]|uniref:lantibiotic dehydratase C-terminal domain-containing protein n=1 Tax=unclassified Streptomyces TaxID=2593676 RepID=UPI000CD4A648|nr:MULTISPECIES: lantibiotic dehydratase C-terminal domain-containing protein [unclassified Streptomyces]